MQIIIENVSDLKRIDENTIDMKVKFSHLSEPILFTANKFDTMDYGRNLYELAESGQFGEIEENE